MSDEVDDEDVDRAWGRPVLVSSACRFTPRR
jgi:hypothetical protein